MIHFWNPADLGSILAMFSRCFVILRMNRKEKKFETWEHKVMFIALSLMYLIKELLNFIIATLHMIIF